MRSAIINTPPTFHLIGRSAHPTRHSKQLVLAQTSGQRVGKLPSFDGVVAQVLAELRLNGGHDFFLWQGFTETLRLFVQPDLKSDAVQPSIRNAPGGAS
jgi:hypothetical protein